MEMNSKTIAEISPINAKQTGKFPIKPIAIILAIAVVITAALVLLIKPKKDIYVVEMEVEGYGVITMELVRTNAPATVDNFIKLAESNFYDGLTFIRAQEGFVIQGGDPLKGQSKAPEGENVKQAASIPGEFTSNGFYKNHISHIEGVISMARSNDPDSASSQFFITLGDARASLDGKYAGFGYVDEESMEVVHAIAEAMYPYADASMGFVYAVEKQVVITDVRVVDSYNID